jgi:hypothetical protein
MMKEAILSSERSVLSRAAFRHIPEGGILFMALEMGALLRSDTE